MPINIIFKSSLILTLGILLFSGCEDKSKETFTKNILEKKHVALKQKVIIKDVKSDFENKIIKLGQKIGEQDIIYTKLTPKVNLYWQDKKENKTIQKDKKGSESYCENLNFKGFTDWRVPSKSELMTINEEKNKFKHIMLEQYNNTYWSSTNYSYDTSLRGLVPKKRSATYAISFTKNNYDINARFNDTTAYIRCVRQVNYETITFENYKKLRLYNTYFVSQNKYLENERFGIKNKYGTLNQLLYTKKPFPEIKKLTQELTNLYLQPRRIVKETLPTKVKKVLLQKLPKFIKDEYETNDMFQKRIKDTKQQRKKQIKLIETQYMQDTNKRNKIIETINSKYLAKLENVKKEQVYKKSIIEQNIIQFSKGAFNTVMGNFKFKKISYDAETSMMYITIKATRGNYIKKINFKINPSNAKVFANNIKMVISKPVFAFKNNKIIFTSIEAIYQNNTYLSKFAKPVIILDINNLLLNYN